MSFLRAEIKVNGTTIKPDQTVFVETRDGLVKCKFIGPHDTKKGYVRLRRDTDDGDRRQYQKKPDQLILASEDGEPIGADVSIDTEFNSGGASGGISDLNVRSFIKAAWLRSGLDEEKWRPIAKYVLSAGQAVNDPEFAKVYDINWRFDTIGTLTQLVIDGGCHSLIITGQGGIGKTYEVNKQMELAKWQEDDQFTTIKGYCTPKSLYRALHDWNGSTLVFDDCDSILRDEASVNLLKGALDTSKRRRISWLSEGNGGDLPESFEFTGSIIFISNLPLKKFSQPILSRAIFVDVTMTASEKMDRIRHIAPMVEDLDTTAEQRDEVLDLMTDMIKGD